MLNEITHFHLFCGIGGGALGFQQSSPRIPGTQAKYRCLGGIDNDASAVRDFSRLVGVDGSCSDLFSREQYVAWHGRQPPPDWREATSEDIRRAAGNERPNVVFTSPPCKGYSGLLPEASSKTPKYQAMNGLAMRGVWLAMEAWADDPPEFFILENVPRIATRGRHLLDQIGAILRHYGYAVNETVHDCGELGGLAQSRKRFLLVARHQDKVPPYLHTPRKMPLRSVGSVLESLPVPLGEQANPMHRLPRLSWATWVRLALIPPGGDWRSLRDLRVENGVLADFAIHASYQDGVLGVRQWDGPTGTVTGRSQPTNGAFAIADPRVWSGQEGKTSYKTGGHFGITPWGEPAGAVSGSACHDNGPWSIADPRVHLGDKSHGQYGVATMDQPSHAVTGAATHRNGWWTIADPRAQMTGDYGQYGILRWDQSTGAVSSQSAPGGGRYSVADPRDIHLHDPTSHPAHGTKGVFLIKALHGCAWHRPFTTLELATLQGFVDLDGPLDGTSDTRWRMAIGNAVPPPAAKAIAEVIGRTILLARAGEDFSMGSTPVWVGPLVAAVSIPDSTARLGGMHD